MIMTGVIERKCAHPSQRECSVFHTGDHNFKNMIRVKLEFFVIFIFLRYFYVFIPPLTT